MALKPALIVVDVQNDFCELGALSVSDTLSLIDSLNRVLHQATAMNMACIFTRDWHPVDHCSFERQGGPWPEHCVQGIEGARFAAGLQVPRDALVISKGASPSAMGYSAFEDTELASQLTARGIGELAICGIATEFCVKQTVLDGMRYGWPVIVLTDLVRAVESQPGDSELAQAAMLEAGATMALSSAWLQHR